MRSEKGGDVIIQTVCFFVTGFMFRLMSSCSDHTHDNYPLTTKRGGRDTKSSRKWKENTQIVLYDV